MHTNESVTLTRDVEAAVIPVGTKVTLLKGETAYITQSLGGAYTVIVNGNMFRIDGQNADALGLQAEQKQSTAGHKPRTLEEVEKESWVQMKTCYDPEIPVNIVDLGLIYDSHGARLRHGPRAPAGRVEQTPLHRGSRRSQRRTGLGPPVEPGHDDRGGEVAAGVALRQARPDIASGMNVSTAQPTPDELIGRPPPSAFKRKWTYTRACAELPETLLPIEIWDGTLVMAPIPFFLHQDIIARFFRVLDQWVRRRRLGIVILSPMDVVFKEDLVLQPDVMFIAKDRTHIIQRHVMGAPDLAVEVVSDGRRKRDYKDKRERYEEHGVKEYWILDPEQKHIEVWALEADFFVLQDRYTGRQFAPSRLHKTRKREGEKTRLGFRTPLAPPSRFPVFPFSRFLRAPA